MNTRIRKIAVVFHLFSAFVVIGLLAPVVQAAEFVVTRTDDPAPDGCAPGDCSLREAVIAANAAAGADTITLPAGTFTLSIAGAAGVDDIDPAISDLDIGWGGLTINGAGAASTTIQAAAGLNHSVFDMPIDIFFAPSAVTMNNLTITGGNASTLGGNNRGGAIDSGSRHVTLNLNGVVIFGNTSASGGAFSAMER
ncbi:MAG: hypothetical protein IPK83_10485 [Planctomycetes bacterium]|nr:hypothetical protein [Planctomycetota bacterium]